MRNTVCLALASLAAGISFTGIAVAGEVKIPKQISWTAYGTTSSGYAQSVGLGQMLKKKYDVDLRIIPGKNDVSRMAPLRTRQSNLCACGIAAYFAQEGVYMFAKKKWGPQRLFNVFNNIGRNGQQAIAAGDVGIKTVADFRGKRVTWVKGAPALNINMTAMLAFGGLTWEDVEKVVVPGWKQSAEAVVNGQADVTWGSTVSGSYNKLAASPRGHFWVTLPHSDDAAWKRAQTVAPHWKESSISNVIGGTKNTSGELPYEGNNYPYPIFVAMSNASDDLGYGLTKAVMENYEQFKDSGPSMDGYKLSNQNLNWVFPYHAGAIRYYKEKGLWTAEHDAHNAKLLKRQDVLAAAWKEVSAKNLSGDAFASEWLKIRAAYLEKSGLSVPFRN